MSNRPFTPTRTPTLGHVPLRDRIARVVITGGECTGKTTLAEQLGAAFNAPWVAEYARGYAASVGRPLTASDVESIAHGQMAAEDAAEERVKSAAPGIYSPRLLFLDTDLVSTTVYAEHYYGATPEWVTNEARARKGDLYLLCAPDLYWEGDGIRDLPEAREDIHRQFAARLRELGVTVLLVEGQGVQRFNVALAAVRGWRAASARRG